MTEAQVALIVAAFLLIAIATLFGMKGWLRGWTARIVYFLAGAGVIACLRAAAIPPQWFDGTIGDFLFAALLIAWAFAWKTKAEAVFRIPFVLGFGLALLFVSVWAHV